MRSIRLPAAASLRRRHVWLLWLALLLPLSQGAVAWHALSHAFQGTVQEVGQQVGQQAAAPTDDDQAAAHAAHCDLCLTAAALGSGALHRAPVVLPAADARHQAPWALAHAQPAVARAWAYRSRAPPAFQR